MTEMDCQRHKWICHLPNMMMNKKYFFLELDISGSVKS